MWQLEKDLTGYLEVMQPTKSRLKEFFDALQAHVELDSTLSMRKMTHLYISHTLDAAVLIT